MNGPIETTEPLYAHNTNVGAPGNYLYTMKSFFRRPSWASRGNEDATPDFYRRSGQTYADIIAATKEERERSATDPSSDHSEDGETAKCRRSSNKACVKDDDTPLCTVTGKQDQARRVSGENHPSPINPGSHGIFQQGREHSSHQASGIAFADVNNTSHHYNTLARDSEPTPDSQSADWLKEPSHSNSISDDESVSEGLDNSQKTECETSGNDKPAQNTIVQILITSEIENTKALIVHRKMSQSLREVRLAWCKRQGFTEEMQSSVFLTWKGRRLFDVTTCKSLGFNITDIRSSMADEGTMRVHMEAVTEDLFTSKRQQQQLSRMLPTSESQPDQQFADIENKKQDVLIKVVLKCPGLVDYGTRVSKKTQVSQIIASFKEAQRVPTEKQVYLLFDGDRLDPDSCLVDYDIADLDLVDVILR